MVKNLIKRYLIRENKLIKMSFGGKAKTVHRNAVAILEKLSVKAITQDANWNKTFNDLITKAEGLEILLDKAEAKIVKLTKKKKK